MGSRGRLSRRGLLGLIGSGAFAGCNVLEGGLSDGDATVRSHELPDVGEEDEWDPVVVAAVPVDIDPAYLSGVHDRVTSLLAALPTPLGPAEIPNGHVRERLTDAAAEATSKLDDARTAKTDFSALETLRSARGKARYAAAGWAVADEGLTVSEVQQDRRQWWSEAQSLREAHEYHGDDPIRATLVHFRIEDALAWATDRLSVNTSPGNDGELLTVAEWADAAETTRALVADARHLDEVFTASLSADVRSTEATLTSAADALMADGRSRRTDLPPEPTADDWGPAQEVIDELRWVVETGPNRVSQAAGPASAIIEANRQLAALRAVDNFVTDADADGSRRPERAADVHRLRSSALETVRTALKESTEPGVTRTVLTDAASRIVSADWELGRLDGEVQVTRLDDVVSKYLIGRALARAAPAATRETVDAIQSV